MSPEDKKKIEAAFRRAALSPRAQEFLDGTNIRVADVLLASANPAQYAEFNAMIECGEIESVDHVVALLEREYPLDRAGMAPLN